MAQARFGHTATLLLNGGVLVAGGGRSGAGSLASAERYDPAKGAWTQTANPSHAHVWHTATSLVNGKVLIAGGDGNAPNGSVLTIASVELFDPAAGVWADQAALSAPRAFHMAALLNSGVLVMGGEQVDIGDLASAELLVPR